MMHTDMVTKVSFRRMAKERADKPCDVTVDPLVRSFETFAVTDAMKHQAKSSFKVKLGYIKINGRHSPPNPSLQKGSIQDDSWDNYNYM
jgi:hypothetical protein